MNVRPGSSTVVIEDGGSRYEVRASSPDELRTFAAAEERRAIRLNDRRLAEKALKYRRAADIWERDRATAATTKKAQTSSRRADTQRKKDEFTAAYGSGAERTQARKRLGWDG
jgi:hypothetical protein